MLTLPAIFGGVNPGKSQQAAFGALFRLETNRGGLPTRYPRECLTPASGPREGDPRGRDPVYVAQDQVVGEGHYSSGVNGGHRQHRHVGEALLAP
jgi:hypothetical protein